METNKDIYYLIPIERQTRKEFFESEFGNYNYDADEVSINGTNYIVERIEVNGEQFLISGHEIVKCTPTEQTK